MDEKASEKHQNELGVEEKDKKLRKLTPKQQRFVEEVMVTSSPTEAVRRVYRTQNAKVMARKLMRTPNVAAAVASARAARAERLELKEVDIVRELTLLIRSDIVEHFEIDLKTGKVRATEGAPKGITRAISRLDFDSFFHEGELIRTKCKVGVWDKNRAIHTYATHLGMLTHHHKIDASGTAVIVVVPSEEVTEPEPSEEA